MVARSTEQMIDQVVSARTGHTGSTAGEYSSDRKAVRFDTKTSVSGSTMSNGSSGNAGIAASNVGIGIDNSIRSAKKIVPPRVSVNATPHKLRMVDKLSRSEVPFRKNDGSKIIVPKNPKLDPMGLSLLYLSRVIFIALLFGEFFYVWKAFGKYGRGDFVRSQTALGCLLGIYLCGYSHTAVHRVYLLSLWTLVLYNYVEIIGARTSGQEDGGALFFGWRPGHWGDFILLSVDETFAMLVCFLTILEVYSRVVIEGIMVFDGSQELFLYYARRVRKWFVLFIWFLMVVSLGISQAVSYIYGLDLPLEAIVEAKISTIVLSVEDTEGIGIDGVNGFSDTADAVSVRDSGESKKSTKKRSSSYFANLAWSSGEIIAQSQVGALRQALEFYLVGRDMRIRLQIVGKDVMRAYFIAVASKEEFELLPPSEKIRSSSRRKRTHTQPPKASRAARQVYHEFVLGVLSSIPNVVDFGRKCINFVPDMFIRFTRPVFTPDVLRYMNSKDLFENVVAPLSNTERGLDENGEEDLDNDASVYDELQEEVIEVAAEPDLEPELGDSEHFEPTAEEKKNIEEAEKAKKSAQHQKVQLNRRKIRAQKNLEMQKKRHPLWKRPVIVQNIFSVLKEWLDTCDHRDLGSYLKWYIGNISEFHATTGESPKANTDRNADDGEDTDRDTAEAADALPKAAPATSSFPNGTAVFDGINQSLRVWEHFLRADTCGDLKRFYRRVAKYFHPDKMKTKYCLEFHDPAFRLLLSLLEEKKKRLKCEV